MEEEIIEAYESLNTEGFSFEKESPLEILNKSTIQNSISEDQLEEIKNFIKAGYLEREHTTSEGKVIKIKNLPIDDKDKADILKTFKICYEISK